MIKNSISTFIPLHPLNTAVLFLIFNRLDTTKQVFEAIRQAKPPRLYIAADGARELREGEDIKVQAVREYVMSNIDWKCEVKTLFREENLGCKYAVSSAITWFFENEEMGIILEDDCLPSQSFFWYCEELLERYKDDMRVWHIGGSNFQNGIKRGDGDYYFSKYNHIWGWASWANRWKYYNLNLEKLSLFKDENIIESVFTDKVMQKQMNVYFEDVQNNKIDTWDYQWQYTLWSQNALSILPNVNLISNIGFGVESTHTKDSDSIMSNKVREELTVTVHPSFVCRNFKADYDEFIEYYQNSFLKKIKIYKTNLFNLALKFLRINQNKTIS